MKINEVYENKFLIEIELLARFKYFLWKIYEKFRPTKFENIN